MINISLSIEPISPFQATFIGSPYSAQLLSKTTKPQWVPSVNLKQHTKSLNTLPEFIQAADYALRETLSFIEIPPRFDKSKIYAIVMDRLTDYVESNIQLKSFIQTFEKTTFRKDPQTYIKTLKRYSSEIDEIASSQIKGFAYIGLNSDIPFSVFCDLSLAYTTYQKVLKHIIEVAESRIGKLPIKGFRPQTIETKLVAYTREIKPVVQEYAMTSEKQFKLLLYADIANSSSYEDIFKPKILKYDAMNVEAFERYYIDFRVKMLNLRRTLYNVAPKLFEDGMDKNSPLNFLWITSAKEALGGLVDEQ